MVHPSPFTLYPPRRCRPYSPLTPDEGCSGSCRVGRSEGWSRQGGKGKARAASPCTNPYSASFSSNCVGRPPLFPRTSSDSFLNLKSRSSTPGLVSLLLSSSVVSPPELVLSDSLSTYGSPSSYFSDLDTHLHHRSPHVTVVGSPESDEGQMGEVDMFWSPLEDPVVGCSTRRPSEFSFTSTSTTSTSSSSSSSSCDCLAFGPSRAGGVKEQRREPVPLGHCPLTNDHFLQPEPPVPSFPNEECWPPTHSTRRRSSCSSIPPPPPLSLSPTEPISSDGGGAPQNLFYLSILKLLSIPPEPPSAPPPCKRPCEEETYLSSLPLLLIAPASVSAPTRDVARPCFPALKDRALVRFVVQLEMMREGKIVKGRGHRSWDRILVWKEERKRRREGSLLRWELGC